MSLQLTSGYAFTSGETNVTHTKLNNAINNAAAVAGSIATVDIADDAITADKLNANVAGAGLVQDTDGSIKIVGEGFTSTALTSVNVTLTRDSSKWNQKFTGTLTGPVVINLSRTNAVAGDEFDVLVSAVDTTGTNTLTFQENGSGSLLVYNSVATVSQEILFKYSGSAWIVFSVAQVSNTTAGTVTSVDASGGVETVTGSAITGSGTIRLSNIVNAQTGTTYTYLTGDRGKLVTHANGSAIAGTLPQAGGAFPSGWSVSIQNRGAGTLTITPTTSTIDGAATLDVATNQGVVIYSDGTNYFTMRGLSSSGTALPTGFTSTAQSITFSSTITVAHGLGSIPRIAKMTLKCVSTEGNYSANDLIELASLNGSANIGVCLVKDATNLKAIVGNTIRLLDKTAYTNFDITAAKWNIIFEAFL